MRLRRRGAGGLEGLHREEPKVLDLLPVGPGGEEEEEESKR